VLLHYLIGVVFIMHGLAHLSGMMAAFTARDVGFSDKPWLFSTGATLRSPIGQLFGLVWLAAAIALVGSILSLIAIVPWWNTVVPGARAGAAFDGLMLIGLVAPWSEQVMAALGV